MSLIRVRQPAKRYDPFAVRASRAAAHGQPSGAIPRGAKGPSTSDHFIPAPLVHVPVGTQTVGVTVPRKVVNCEEFGCEWFIKGHEGEDEGKPFAHPAGARCGDHDECLDDNCPCPQRLVWEMVGGVLTGVRGHLAPDYEQGPTWRVNAGRGLCETTSSEVVDRLHEGTEAIREVVDRARNGAGQFRALGGG